MYIFESKINNETKQFELVFDCHKVNQTPITLFWCKQNCKRYKNCKIKEYVASKEHELNNPTERFGDE